MVVPGELGDRIDQITGLLISLFRRQGAPAPTPIPAPAVEPAPTTTPAPVSEPALGEDDPLPKHQIEETYNKVAEEMDFPVKDNVLRRLFATMGLARRSIRTSLVHADLITRFKRRVGLGWRDSVPSAIYDQFDEASEEIVEAGMASGHWNGRVAMNKRIEILDRLSAEYERLTSSTSPDTGTTEEVEPTTAATPTSTEEPGADDEAVLAERANLRTTLVALYFGHLKPEEIASPAYQDEGGIISQAMRNSQIHPGLVERVEEQLTESGAGSEEQRLKVAKSVIETVKTEGCNLIAQKLGYKEFRTIRNTDQQAGINKLAITLAARNNDLDDEVFKTFFDQAKSRGEIKSKSGSSSSEA